MPTDIYARPAELLQQLIRHNTTNPPGSEGRCVGYIGSLLDSLGIENKLIVKQADRPNLVARLKGRGDAPPLLLYGHVDVVPTEGQKWAHPPFEGKIVDDVLWGRGTLDMKGGVAMMLAAFMRAKAENLALPGDLILCIVSDEEAGGDMGAKFLAENHAREFEGVKYAIGEFGGFSMMVGGRRFYPIQVAERHICWLKATVRGPGGHGAFPHRGPQAATYKLGKILQILNTQRLPVHITPPAQKMFEMMAEAVGESTGAALRGLLNPATTDSILDEVGEPWKLFDSMLHNTVSPNLISGGTKINVIPGEISLEMDGRLLPGQSEEDVMAELRAILGDDVELETIRYEDDGGKLDMGMFDLLSHVLKEADPTGIPVPFMLPAVTDARHFARLGIQTYGYLPMNLPDDFQFLPLIHAANERIPVQCLDFGTQAIYTVLSRFGG